MRRVLKADLDTFESEPSSHILYFRKRVEAEKRYEMVLLNGHLLLEASMNEFIEIQAKLPADLSKARYIFAQKVTLCRILGLFGPFPREEKIPQIDLETILFALNEARNKLAHRVEWDKRASARTLISKVGKQPLLKAFLAGKPIEQLRTVISTAYATIAATNRATRLLKHIENRRTAPRKKAGKSVA